MFRPGIAPGLGVQKHADWDGFCGNVGVHGVVSLRPLGTRPVVHDSRGHERVGLAAGEVPAFVSCGPGHQDHDLSSIGPLHAGRCHLVLAHH